MAVYKGANAFIKIPPGDRSGTFTLEGMKPVDDADLEGLFTELVITAVMVDGQRHELDEPLPVRALENAHVEMDSVGKPASIRFGDIVIDR